MDLPEEWFHDHKYQMEEMFRGIDQEKCQGAKFGWQREARAREAWSEVRSRFMGMYKTEFPSATDVNLMGVRFDQLGHLLREGGSAKDYLPEINIEGDHNTVTITINAPAHLPQTPPAPVDDEDPHRFSLGEVFDLRAKLEAHPYFAELLADQNERLAENKVAKLTPKVVAAIGCIMRKNIRQPKDEAGAVPFKAITLFCKRSDDVTGGKVPHRLQIGGSISILEAVRFLKQTRKATGYGGKCAAYALLNEAEWESPKTPSHSPASC